MKFEFVKPLSATTDLVRTREGTIECKVNNARAPVVWLRKGKEIGVRSCVNLFSRMQLNISFVYVLNNTTKLMPNNYQAIKQHSLKPSLLKVKVW